MKGSELERKVRKGCHQLQPSPLLVQPLKFYSELDSEFRLFCELALITSKRKTKHYLLSLNVFVFKRKVESLHSTFWKTIVSFFCFAQFFVGSILLSATEFDLHLRCFCGCTRKSAVCQQPGTQNTTSCTKKIAGDVEASSTTRELQMDWATNAALNERCYWDIENFASRDTKLRCYKEQNGNTEQSKQRHVCGILKPTKNCEPPTSYII